MLFFKMFTPREFVLETEEFIVQTAKKADQAAIAKGANNGADADATEGAEKQKAKKNGQGQAAAVIDGFYGGDRFMQLCGQLFYKKLISFGG